MVVAGPQDLRPARSMADPTQEIPSGYLPLAYPKFLRLDAYGGFSRRAPAARVSKLRPYFVGDRSAVLVLHGTLPAPPGRDPGAVVRGRRHRGRAGRDHAAD